MNSYTIELNSIIDLTDEQFFQVCKKKPGFKI